jgi:hypothetical protein
MPYYYGMPYYYDWARGGGWQYYLDQNSSTSSLNLSGLGLGYLPASTATSSLLLQRQNVQQFIPAGNPYAQQAIRESRMLTQLAAPAIIHRRPEPDTAIDRRIMADDRALQLLLDNLDDRQCADFRAHKEFTVLGASGQRYIVECSRSYSVNIRIGGRRERLCAHLRPDVPLADHFLAQKFMLEHDEQAFLRIANRHAA